MIIMTLDHTRDFLHANPTNIEPTDLANASPALFMTRWITHLCAPTFVFLSGVSTYISLSQQTNIKAHRNFLIKRGLWLIFVNFTINNFGIFFDIHFGVFFSQVIAVIGFGFLILAALLNLSARTIGIIGGIIILGHNLFQGITFTENQTLNFIWTYLMRVGYFQLTPNTGILISYAIIPWTGILLLGFGVGKIIHHSSPKPTLLSIGLYSLVAFLILRYVNYYGDPRPWAIQKNSVMTILSFINTTKQPPSLLFVLMTLGIAFLLLSYFSKRENIFTKWLMVFGKVPLFYWLIHWYFLHLIAIIYYLSQGYKWSELQFAGFGFGRPADNNGLPLWGVYIAWFWVVIALYPISAWYAAYKMQNKDKQWLRYL
jgi:uncharacterized membrane protein